MRNKILFLFLGIIFLVSFVSAFSMPDPYGDYDRDGVLNKDDNCYYVYNPFQVDSDGDGWGNCCDADYVGLSGWCDYNGGFCGDGICSGNEDSVNCLADCPAPIFCGNNILESGEQCDDGILNGVKCNNSSSSCEYCSLSCGIIKLSYSEDDNNNSCYSKVNRPKFYCEPNWDCGGWSSCEWGVKTRECFDMNYCEYFYNKPFEVVGCEEAILEKVLIEDDFNYLFLVFGLVGVLLIIIFVVVLVFLLRFGKPKSS